MRLFQLEQTVRLKTDRDKLDRIITAVIQRPSNTTYELSCGTITSVHYYFEIEEIDQADMTRPGFKLPAK